LWEMWMVEGLEAGGWALISKVHHCMVDGVAGTDLLTVLLDREPRPAAARTDDWRPSEEPSDLRLLADAAADAIVDPVNRIRGLLGGTVNDVVLAAITRGFRDLLLARGEQVEGKVVRTLVPVSVRRESERGVYNNRVSGLFPGLPVGIADPVERLQAIREDLDRFKRSGQAVAGDALTRLSGF